MRICPQCSLRTEARVCEVDGYQTVDEGLLSESGDPRVGLVFEERYRIEGVLGRGGMGTVYRATQLSVDRAVAVKVLNADRVQDLTTIARFQQEARSVAALKHPNTIRLIDFGQAEDGTLYLVMEFLEGEPLSALLKRESPLDPERVIRFGIQVLESLAEAHSVGIIHRDLKPDNLFVTELFGRPDFVKILDFGIAKVSGFGQDPNLTGVGVALGSPRYMAPEQASAGTVDARADLYALGVVLYEMLTGKPPFLCASVAQYMLAHVESDVPSMEIDARPLTGRLPEFIYTCLSKHPLHRPSGAVQALERLRACAGAPFQPVSPPLGSEGAPTVTSSTPGSRRRSRTESAVLSGIPAVTAFDAEAASAPPAAAQVWQGNSPSDTKSPRGVQAGLRASETGLSPRGPSGEALSASRGRAWPLLLAAVSLLGFGAATSWWVLSERLDDEATGAIAGDLMASPEASSKVAVVTERVAPLDTGDAPSTEVGDGDSDEAQGVVLLITVPPGATVTRGAAVLGVTPFALVWSGDGDRRGLEVRLKGYQRERLTRADVGAAGRYELYLRPAGSARPRRKGSRRASKGAWIETISKTSKKANNSASTTGPKQPPEPPIKPAVYEELD